jgi:hypothetical protein
MATLDLTTARQAFDMNNGDIVRFGSANLRFNSHWSWITPDGHDLELFGSGLTYDANGRALSGSITSIEFDLGNDGFPVPDVVIRGINTDAKLLDNSPAAFWSILSGDDTFLGPLIENGGTGFSRLFGDALQAPAGAASGGDDLFRAGDTAIHVAGDVFDVNTGAAFTGGNDRIFGAPTEQSQGLSGDAFTVQGTGVLIGGDDIMAIRAISSTTSFAFGDATTVHGFGGLAKVLGGDDKIIAEDGSSAQLSGDVGTVVQNARITGGNDTIGGSECGEAITGDVFTMLGGSGVEITGGSDALNGKGGNDIISGDVHVSRSGGIITGGNDTINGGEGADRIFGEIASGDGVSIGGNDQLFGDAGNDSLNGQSGNDILDGGADNDLLDGGIGNDTVFVSEGRDIAVGGAGIDTLRFSNLGAAVSVDLLRTTVALNNAAGDVLTFREFERVIGTSGADTILGDNQANALLAGGSGNDIINGRGGADIITGGAGSDRMVGGEGADTFDFNAVIESGVASTARDVIFDFAARTDKVDISAIDAIAGGANDAFTFIGGAAFTAAGQVRAVQTGAHTVLEFNTNGTTGAEFAIVLANFTATALTQGDFIA